MNGMYKLAPRPERDAIRQTEGYKQDYNFAKKQYTDKYTGHDDMSDARRRVTQLLDFYSSNQNINRLNAVVAATIDALDTKKGKPDRYTLLVAGSFITDIAETTGGVGIQGEDNAELVARLFGLLHTLPMGVGLFGGRNELDSQVLKAVLGALNGLDIDAWKDTWKGNRDFALQTKYRKMVSDFGVKLAEIEKKNKGDIEIARLAKELRERLA